MVKKFIFIFVIITSTLSAQQIDIYASVDTSDYYIGDYINYTFQITAGENITFVKPSIQDSLKNLEVIKMPDPVEKKENENTILTYNITLSRYDSAEVTIPSIPVYYWNEKEGEKHAPLLSDSLIAKDTTLQVAYSNSVSFNVHRLDVNVQEDIKDVKEPVTIPMNWWMVALYVLIGLLIVGTLVFLYFKYWRKREEEPKPKKKIKIPPHVVALNSLDMLEKKELWQKGKIKEYHSEITEIIRLYFEERFDTPALELPTSELLELLRRRSDTREVVEVTEKFLSNADLVKFAKFKPMDEVNKEMMKQAKEIVEKTKEEKSVAEKQTEEVKDV